MAGRRKRRRAYLDDYKINEDGQYEYQGARYKWTIDDTRRQVLQRELRLMAVAAVFVSLLAGCIPAPGVGHSAYLLLPYAGGVVAVISLCFAVWRMCGEKDPMRGHIYDTSVKKIPFRAMLTVIFAAISVTGEVIYLLRNGSEGMLFYGFLFLLLEGVACLTALCILQKIRSLEWRKII